MIDKKAKNRTDLHKVDQSAPVGRFLTQVEGQVTSEDRYHILRQNPIAIWLTGLSGAGKSTIAYSLEKKLIDMGYVCYVLDGDNIRHGLNKDLGFSPEDRCENIRRVAEVAKLYIDAGLIIITAFISPYRDDRENARTVIGSSRLIDVFVDAPLEVCEERDVKDLYRKARAGEIPDFTGISSPYECPEKPCIHLRTDQISIDEEVNIVVNYLIEQGVIDLYHSESKVVCERS